MPGQPGTKRLVEKYGNNLVCVRYRYDEKKMTAFKTAEIIVEKKPWKKRPEKPRLSQIMHIRVDYDEIDIRQSVKEAGGIWNPAEKVWELPFSEVLALNLENRIVG